MLCIEICSLLSFNFRFSQNEKFEKYGVEISFNGLLLKARYEAMGLTVLWDGFISVQVDSWVSLFYGMDSSKCR